MQGLAVRVQDVAVGFVNMFLGASYVAVHLRRGDFFGHCLRGPGRLRQVPCYFPMQQTARCLHARLHALAHAPSSPFHTLPLGMVFLASNADDAEMAALDAALHSFAVSRRPLGSPTEATAARAPLRPFL